MAARICVVLALIAISSADPDCTESGTCVDDVHEVSLLQTEIKVKPSKTAQAAVHPHVQANIQVTDAAGSASVMKEATGIAPTTHDALMGAGLVVSLLVVCVVLNLQVPSLKFKQSSTDAPKYMAEFLGTWMLVFSVGCNVLVGNPTWGVTSIACTLMVCIYAMGSVSGANFNPAVSIALGLSEKMEWAQVAVYVCIQLAAGICAALSYGFMLGNSFNLEPKPGHNIMTATIAELLYTFMLTFVVLNVAATKSAQAFQYYGLAIGFTVIAGGYGAGSISGGCFNPAIAFGVDFSTMSQGFGHCLGYIASEIVGCAIAAAMFRICRPEEVGGEASENKPGKLLSEFLGTFMLVLTVSLNVLNKSPAGAFSIAASLMCMVFALGSVSGGHFNPAVTLAVLVQKRIAHGEALQYIISQICGGLCAASTASFLMHGASVPLGPVLGVDARKALVGEFIFTFLLCFVVCSVAIVEKPLVEYFGLAIGACVIAGGYAIGGLSGGSLNPAVSTALAVTNWYKGGVLTHLVPYVAVELSGGLVASLLFSKIHVSDDKA